jgi:hypothetical protein
VIDSGAFKEILSTISALAANDDRIIEYFRGISQGRSPSGSSRVSFEWDERLAQNIDVAKLVHELEIKCWGRLARLSWRPFDEARNYIRSLKLQSTGEWELYAKGMLPGFPAKPHDIPASPAYQYSTTGWAGFSDWIGTSKSYRDFESARTFVRSLKLDGERGWRNYAKTKILGIPKIPADIPIWPHIHYKDFWKGYGDWTGSDNTHPRDFKHLPFQQARAFARSLGLDKQSDWKRFCKGEIPGKPPLPKGISTNPNRTYADDGWIDFSDWLGASIVAPQNMKFRSFAEARDFARMLGLKKEDDWREFARGLRPEIGVRPLDIPIKPDSKYRKTGWNGWGDFLGNGNVATYNRVYLSFAEALIFVRKLNLRNREQWLAYCQSGLPRVGKKPDNIPTYPNKTYANKGWVGMSHWLGNGVTLKKRKKA